jgi:pimeloyl-ACP methyl ester carboxylesterase
VDHARIVGTLYPGKRGKEGACILMLHEMGRDRQVEAWKRLAEALQEEGHTVLTFDFRGHGDSKHVSRDFWSLQVNRDLPVYRRGKVGDEPPRTIEAGDFSPEYLPWMIHDIAAARMFLDRLHEDENSPVNSSNLMIFGAGRGAALGSLWLASEAIRYDASGTGKKIKLMGLKNSDIIRADWLGIETKWKDHKFPVKDWVHWAHHMYSDSMVPMEFMFGAGDTAAALVVGEVRDGKNGVPKPIPGARLAGMMLLEKDASSEKLIRAYLVKVLKEHNYRKWKPRKLETLHSYWGFPTPAGGIDFYLARRPEERLLHPVPLGGFGIRLEGMPQPRVVVPGAEE